MVQWWDGMVRTAKVSGYLCPAGLCPPARQTGGSRPLVAQALGSSATNIGEHLLYGAWSRTTVKEQKEREVGQKEKRRRANRREGTFALPLDANISFAYSEGQIYGLINTYN